MLDAGGNPVALAREDGCGLLRVDIAKAKAWTGLAMGMSPRALRDRFVSRPAFLGALSDVSAGRIAPAPGGVLILVPGGVGDGCGAMEVVGAVGVSGDTSEKDEFVAVLAVQSAGLAADPAVPSDGWRESSLAGHSGCDAPTTAR